MPRRGESIWKRKDGRWEARYISYRDADGKAHYSSVYAKSYSEAKSKRLKLLVDKPYTSNTISNAFCARSDQTIVSIAYKYIDNHRTEIKDSTCARYRGLVKWYIAPYFDQKSITMLNQEDIDQFSSFLLVNGGSKKEGISPKTAKDTLTLLKQVLKYTEEDIPSLNQIKVKSPRQTGKPIEILSASDQKILEAYIINNITPVTFGILLSLYTGIRIGELCGLMWGDINLEDGQIRISRTVIRINSLEGDSPERTKLVIESPKTAASERMIPIHSFLLESLKEMKQRLFFSNNTYFLTGTNKIMEPRNYYERYQKIIRECNIRKYTFHALRHTFATRCIEAGMDAKVLSEILGHSNVQITLNRYVHPSLSAKKAAIEKLNLR